MKRLIILVILSIMLTACSNKSPSVVTDFILIKPDVPYEFLEAEKAPNPIVLKNVRVCEGEKELREYGIALLQTNYSNTQKIQALQELLK